MALESLVETVSTGLWVIKHGTDSLREIRRHIRIDSLIYLFFIIIIYFFFLHLSTPQGQVGACMASRGAVHFLVSDICV